MVHTPVVFAASTVVVHPGGGQGSFWQEVEAEVEADVEADVGVGDDATQIHNFGECIFLHLSPKFLIVVVDVEVVSEVVVVEVDGSVEEVGGSLVREVVSIVEEAVEEEEEEGEDGP